MSREQALITALTRLIAVFYGIKCLDQTISGVLFVFMQVAGISGAAGGLLSGLMLLVPIVAVYLGIAVAVWFLAPRLAKISLPETGGTEDRDLPWNDTMIFCAGLFFMAWAIGRLAEWAVGSGGRGGGDVGVEGMIYLGFTTLLFVFGMVIVGKFHRISEWMRNRRKSLTGE